MPDIKKFEGEYRFLSNFSNHPVTYGRLSYPNAEAAFHAQKCPERAKEFCHLNPSQAKRLGRRVSLRPDWEKVKDDIMYDILWRKFTQNPELKKALLETGDAHLEEGNNWGDKYWGTVNGVGKNKLGKLLMKLRKELSTDKEEY